MKLALSTKKLGDMAGEKLVSATDSYQGMTSQAAEKLPLGEVLKGHDFSRAVND
ncbi:MAG: hypothetical protein WBS19_08380 [Candidatus Korobacteraceae bacterium]